MNSGLAFLIGCAVAMVLFFLTWILASRCDNFSWVDAAWAFGVGLIGVFWLTVLGRGCAKHWAVAGLLVLWSARLGWHLQKRIRRTHPEEDARYVKLREVWSGRVLSAFFWFFQAQAASVVLLALPFLIIALDADTTWSAWESAGLCVALVGILGEGLADMQMARFKSQDHGSKSVCQEGLWRYSRHPNYFFEAVIWLGFYLYACGSNWGWAMIYAPCVIIFLLLKVTGIPPTEAAAVARKGDAYRRYQKSTSPFIPLPPRRNNKYF